ncbi:DNA polymerase III subunit alpha [Amorphus orientalis]|uniref:DNA polymerase III subunit alpha n=1 Tax=Amorphus orientalis TaxID=649198 RepID=A0AAE3VNZ1_9HYPH|nr:DNA polymerase III subunit alpha [Amorphus orientalis]MDQ0315541.1 DNA polymerase-3 subunit alpha [Amorphus orientalis]
MDATDGPGFVHLRVHSAFSLLEGALHLKDLIKLAKADKQPAVAITDTGNLFGALEFSEKAAGEGVQPIVGCQLAVAFLEEDGRRRQADTTLPSLVLIAADPTGYANLVKLVSRSHLEPVPGTRPHVPADALAEHAAGLICLSGGVGGPIGQAILHSTAALARRRFDWLAETFGDRFYCELQRHGLPEEATCEPVFIDFAYDAGVPLVATNEAFFPARGDFEAHDALICVAEGRRLNEDNRRQLTPEHYFKTRSEMMELFSDIPEALASTVEIARRCIQRPLKHPPILPRFATGDDVDAAEAEAAEAQALRDKAVAGLAARLAAHGPAPGTEEADYHARLDHELTIIERMKYPGYFLIVADFIQWGKAQGIPVGPGRGSGAGSLVAYALTITDLDPLRFGLLFERFLNPERVSMPDFDIDFCQERRDEVIEYVQDKYGHQQVAQIITFGTLQARAVLRDVGRVLELPYGQVDKLCKLVPANPANPVTLKEAVDGEPKLQEARDEEPIIATLLTMAMKLEGLYRHASTHAAGIVIGDRPLDELVPMYRDPRSDMPVTQFNMKWVEQAGLVKFDFLGLKTLTVIDTAVKLIAQRGIEVDLDSLPLDDAPTYEMLARGETVGVFQLESAGMRKALIGMRPDRFEDLIAIVALYRPGPMDNIPSYNRRKHGEEEPDYLHPLLEPILKETYGIIIYQEQVMQIAQVLSGYSLGDADLLRRAMGKKIKAEMDVQRGRFVDGAVEQGVKKSDASTIFDLVAKFANYGFNKSHAAAYALVAYHTAWLKANYPVEFLAATMTLDMGNTDKLSDFRREAMRLGIKVLPPSVNQSSASFSVADGAIVYALNAIKGVGRPLVDHIVALREERPFRDVTEFAHRINPKIANKRGLECLVTAGAFDTLEPNRARLMEGLDRVLGIAHRNADGIASGQNDFFGGEPQPVELPDILPWAPAETLQREYAAIGFYLSAHPLDDYRQVLERMRVQMWSTFVEAVKRGATAGRLVGTVTQRQERRTRSGNRMGIVRMSDPTGQYEAVIFSDGLAQFRDLLEPGQSVILMVHAEEREEGVSARIQSVEPLDEAALRLKRSLRVFLRDPAPLESLSRHLPKSGDADVSLVLLVDGGRQEVEVKLPGRYQVTPPVASALKQLPGVVQVEFA